MLGRLMAPQVWHSCGVDLLITAADLAADVSSYTVLDVRYRLLGPPARPDYDEGHIPGARFVDLDRYLARSPGTHGRHPLPMADDFGAAMRRCGVSPARPVVCYDFADGTSAARAWWLLRFFGHPDVRVLDGGYAAWRVAAGEPSTIVPADGGGDFVADPGHAGLLDADAAAALTHRGMLLDARSGERYRGESEPIDPVAGHIPGSLSAPTLENVDLTGRFLPADRLRSRFEDLGVTSAASVGVYCGSGVTAAHEVLALELAGIHGAALYADSWSGWITDPQRPVATGGAPG
jgi:thiosulfate/3-mercaptopyruvate sulfurtransferase